MKESKKLAKQQKKIAKQLKGVQEKEIDEVAAQFPPDAFTRDQIKNYLEEYKRDKDQAIKQMKFKLGK